MAHTELKGRIREFVDNAREYPYSLFIEKGRVNLKDLALKWPSMDVKFTETCEGIFAQFRSIEDLETFWAVA